MEQEIASVAAACAMRGFRYLAYPPIAFDAPAAALEPSVEERVTALTQSKPATVQLAAVDLATPQPFASLPTASHVAALLPAVSLPAASHLAASLPYPPARRFALLTDVAASMHRRQAAQPEAATACR